MYEVIVNIIIGIIMTIIHVYAWGSVLDKKIDFSKLKTYLLLILIPCIIVLNYFYVNKYLKIALITFIFIAFCKFLFNVSLNKSILAPIVSQISIAISEFIFALIFLTVVDINDYDAFDNYVGTLIPNVFIALITYFLIKIGLVSRMYKWLLKITNKIKKYDLLGFILILIITINLIQVNIYYKVNLRMLIIINICLMVFYAIIIIKLANIKNNYLTIYSKYHTSLNSLRKYEYIVDKYRVDNHENKNQLMTLKGKIDKRNTRALDYINMILDTRIKDNEKILKKVNVIPEGGLRGLIYSKLLIMEEKNIKYNLHFDKKIKMADIIELGDMMVDEICKIIGVYLDNAIEASFELYNKIIRIDFYKNNEVLYISIMNNFNNVFDADNINRKRYTTKGEGRGYGLSLVEKILENNNKLSNETSIGNGTFKQVLKVELY